MRMKSYSFVKALSTMLLLNMAPLIVQEQVELFQLGSVNEANQCLQIQHERGTLVPCQTENSGLSENTVFLMENGEYGNYKIKLFRTGKCLGYNSTTSNLCLSSCDKHKLIHWNITKILISIEYVSEGLDENCVFKDSGGDVLIHHCSNGYEKFKVITVVDHYNHMVKEDDLVDSFTGFKTNPGLQFNPKPKPAEYLKGNLAVNLLGVMLFRYFYK